MTAALKPLAAIALLAFALVCIITSHGAAARDTGLTRVELFEPMVKASRGQPDEKCTEFLIMSCLSATTHDIASPFYGQANPHAKLACCDKNQFCYTGIVGLKYQEPALVTVIPMTRPALMRTVTRDKCLVASPSWAIYLVEGVLK